MVGEDSNSDGSFLSMSTERPLPVAQVSRVAVRQDLFRRFPIGRSSKTRRPPKISSRSGGACDLRGILPLFLLACTSLAVMAQNPSIPTNAPPKWTRSASLGLTVTSGNSDTLLFAAKVLANVKWAERNELDLGADGTYGEQEDVKNAELFHGFAQYNLLFTPRIFGYLRMDALHDDIADVNYRFTVGPGAGYYFIRNTNTFLRGELGPGVVIEQQGGQDNTYLTFRVAERFEHKLTETARLWQSVEFLPAVDEWDNFIVNAEIGVEMAFNKKWSLKSYLQDTYDHEPAPNRLKNDVKLVTALAYKF